MGERRAIAVLMFQIVFDVSDETMVDGPEGSVLVPEVVMCSS